MPNYFEKITLNPTGICILFKHKHNSTANSLTESKFCPSPDWHSQSNLGGDLRTEMNIFTCIMKLLDHEIN